MIRMLIIGYVFAIRSERVLCRDVQVNLAYGWFWQRPCRQSPPMSAVEGRPAVSSRCRDFSL
jgi:transposase